MRYVVRETLKAISRLFIRLIPAALVVAAIAFILFVWGGVSAQEAGVCDDLTMGDIEAFALKYSEIDFINGDNAPVKEDYLMFAEEMRTTEFHPCLLPAAHIIAVGAEDAVEDLPEGGDASMAGFSFFITAARMLGYLEGVAFTIDDSADGLATFIETIESGSTLVDFEFNG
jgi:hypothetical protein